MAYKFAYVIFLLYLCSGFKKGRIMEAVIYRTAEEKRSARRRLLAIKEAVEEHMRQRMEKMEW